MVSQRHLFPCENAAINKVASAATKLSGFPTCRCTVGFVPGRRGGARVVAGGYSLAVLSTNPCGGAPIYGRRHLEETWLCGSFLNRRLRLTGGFAESGRAGWALASAMGAMADLLPGYVSLGVERSLAVVAQRIATDSACSPASNDAALPMPVLRTGTLGK